jgi:competence protein ComEA
MLWLYRLQQRLAITRREGIAVLTLVGLFLAGWTVRHLQNQHPPPLEAGPLVTVDTGAVVGPLRAPGPININTASATQLQTLSGIGPALSQRIVDYRDTHPPFERVDDLQRVHGIGPKTVDALRARITVEEASPEPRTAARGSNGE